MLRRAPATGGNRPGLGLLEDSCLGSRVGQEPDAAPVRAPEGLDRLVARPGQLLRLPAAGRNDPEARELVADANSVEAPVEVCDATRSRLLRISDPEAVLAALREHRDLRPVGRPLGRAGLALELGQRSRLPSGERQEPGLRLARARRDEDERRPVRREPRPHVAVAGRDLLRRPAAHRHSPEPRPVLAALDRAPPVDDRRPVRRDRELRQERLSKHVLRSESPRGHRAIMDSIRVARYSAGRPEPL